MNLLARAVLVVSIVLWLYTIRHLVTTRHRAKSSLNQMLWLIIVILSPFGVILYWLIEGPRRRSTPPPAFSG